MLLETLEHFLPRVGQHVYIAGLESVSGCRRTKGCLSDYFGVGIWSAIGLVDHTITDGVSVWGC